MRSSAWLRLASIASFASFASLAALLVAGCGDNLAPPDEDEPGDDGPPTVEPPPGPPEPPPDLQPGSFLSPMVQLQRLQGEIDHLHVDEVRLRDDHLLFQCAYTFGVIDATDPQAMDYLAQGLKHTIPGDERQPGCIHLAWDDTDYDIVYTTHRGNIRNPAFLGGWDITDPALPVQIPVLQEPGVSYEGVDVANGNVFVALKQDGLGVYQRDAANNLTRVGTAAGFGSAWGVFARAADNVVFVADSLGGLVTVDAADPVNPVVLGQVATGGQARGVVVDGDTAYVAAGSAGVAVVDVSDLAKPVVVGRATMPGSALRVAVSEGYLSVAAWDDARVYDVSSPAEPRFVGAVRIPQPDPDITDADRPDPTMRVLGIAARGRDLFVGSWWVLHSFRFFPERQAPNIRLAETFMMTDFGRVPAGSQETLPFEVTNQGTAPLTLVNNWVAGSYSVEPRQMRLDPGESGQLSVTYEATSDEMEVGYLQILSDDPQAPLRTAYLVGNQPGLGVGQPMPETQATLLDGEYWSTSQVQDKVLLLGYFATF